MRTKTLMFLITYKCNLRCSYCYEPKVEDHKIGKKLLIKLITEKVKAIPDEYDAFEIHFMGGEPLLEFNLIKDVSEWLWTQKFDKKLKIIYAPTNGTLLTDEIISWCISNKDRFCLGLSFDGDETMQNVNRSGSSSKINLDFFAQTWPYQNVKMTLSPQTVTNIFEGVTFLHNKGFRIVDAELAQGESLNWTTKHLKELSQQLDKLSLFYIENPDKYEFSMLNVDIFAALKKSYGKIKTCSCGEDLICVDIDGKEYACHLFSPITMPLDKARKASTIDFSDASLFSNEKCEQCRLAMICNHCYGMNYLSSGEVSKMNGFQCSVFKIIYLACCRHQLRIARHFNDQEKQEKLFTLINALKYEN